MIAPTIHISDAVANDCQYLESWKIAVRIMYPIDIANINHFI